MVSAADAVAAEPVVQRDRDDQHDRMHHRTPEGDDELVAGAPRIATDPGEPPQGGEENMILGDPQSPRREGVSELVDEDDGVEQD